MNQNTICQYILKMPLRPANRAALKTKKNDKWIDISWQEYYQNVESIAAGLLHLGIKPGAKIAILANTRAEWAYCDLAIMGIKAVTIPIYHTIVTHDLEYILKNSEAEVLFIENESLLKSFASIKDHVPSVKQVICFDCKSTNIATYLKWNDFLKLGNKEEKQQFTELCASIELTDTATIMYTSGTTGDPKGVVVTHEQIMSEISEAYGYVNVTVDDLSLSFLPYSHILGRVELWGHVYVGCGLAYAESIEKIKNNLLEIRPTMLVAVPRIFEKIYSAIYAQFESSMIKKSIFNWAINVAKTVGKYRMNKKPIPIHLAAEYELAYKIAIEKVKKGLGGRLRFAISGGAPIAKDIALFFHACEVLILEGYGLTETTAAITVNAPFDYKFGSVGKPIGDVQLKIAEDGEILVKSKKVMKEYLNDPEATQQAFTDGWFHTGDIGEILESGDLKITDRKKDLIKTAGGKYVAPQKLENMLKLNSFISNVLIHGDQKKYIVALVTLDKPFMTKLAKSKGLEYKDYSSLMKTPLITKMVREAIAETNTGLASYETIKRFLVLPTEFTIESGELTPSLKVKRKVLDIKYAAEIESLYS